MAAQREWFEKDYYKALGVSKSASDKEITKAYRKLAKQLHPDANPGDKKAEDRFKDVSTAYDVLGDAAKRKEYDEVRRMSSSGIGYGGGGPHPGAGGNPFGAGVPGQGQGAGGGGGFGFDDLGDLFGGLFGRSTRQRGAGTQRGDDLEAELHLSFEDAVNGVTTTVNVMSEAQCDRCKGNGAEPGTKPATCPTCHGRGVLDDNQGVFSLSRPCPQCHGSGRVIEHPCKQCQGSGTIRKSRSVKVRIPAGVTDGQHIKLASRGGAGRNGGPPGDLHVTIQVAKHPLFGRRGKDLTVTVPVTFTEASLGAAVKVPTLTTPVTVKVPPGTASGRVLRVRGRGVATKGATGDLLVTIEVKVPAKVSNEERKLIESLADLQKAENVRRHLGVDTDEHS